MLTVAFASIALATAQASPAVTVDRAWTEQCGLSTCGYVMVTVENRASRLIRIMNVECTLLAEDQPADQRTGQAHDIAPGERVNRRISMHRPARFDAVRCRSGAIIWG
jgi:hypothetical protein